MYLQMLAVVYPSFENNACKKRVVTEKLYLHENCGLNCNQTFYTNNEITTFLRYRAIWSLFNFLEFTSK